MKKVKKLVTIIILMAIVGTVTFFIGKQIGLNTDISSVNVNVEEVTVGTKTINKTLTSSGEIKSASAEKLELSTSYYYETICVEEDDIVKKGENIIKYTNGTYLTAPYDCVITQINIPSEGGKCTNEHYIEISSNNILKVKVKIDESKINLITLGQNAIVEVSSYEDKKIEGNITNISNIASNGKFTVTIEFENDGEVMIGMSALVTIKE